MSEQKYYVKLNVLKGSIHKRANVYNTNYHPDYVYFLCEDGKSIAPCFESITEWTEPHAKANDFHLGMFTKSELAEIMDGALYKQTWALPFEWLSNSTSLKEGLGWEYNETIDKFEWTNPLIELVPVEEEE